MGVEVSKDEMMKKYYQTKRERIANSISDALLDLAILYAQENDLPITDESVTNLAAEYAQKPVRQLLEEVLSHRLTTS